VTAGATTVVFLVAAGVLAASTVDPPVPRPVASRAPEVQCRNPAFGASDLTCTPLIPTPDLESRASAVLELQPLPTPFDVSVTVDGRPRQRLIATIAGLPAPRTLGNYSTYMAWAYTLSLDSAVKLGPVTNGRTDLVELDYDQFRILISAEQSPDVAERTGRLVLRGTSPSARLMAHRDLYQPAAMGALLDTNATSTAMEMHGGMMHGASSLGWRMPPVPPWIPMMPGMHGLDPVVKPFLPSADPATLPAAVPSQAVTLHDGDTLKLDARLVRRTIQGKTFTMYGFNGQYPGPLIKVDQGATIIVQFHNTIDQPSAVHWHGVRLDNRFDGVPGVTQPAVPPGGRFTYRVHFTDAGIYWYHPHVREDIEQNLGLYGNMLVRSPHPGYYGPANREEVLMLSDLLVDDHGIAPYGREAPTQALMGRFGTVLRVNGEPSDSLNVKRGEVVRFFFTNVANSRLYNLSFTGARMKVVATDVGKFEREEWVPSVVIAPAQRYVVDVQFDKPGSVTLVNRVQALVHMVGTYFQEVDTLGLIHVTGEPAEPNHTAAFATLRHNADVMADIDSVRPYFSKPVDHTVVLTLRTHGLPAAVSNMLLGINQSVEWNDGMPMMNWLATGKQVTWVMRDSATGKENMDISWRFNQGDLVKLRFINDPSSSHAMDHPIHLHGQRFLVLSRDGVPNENLAWKDTAVIPAGETVDVLVDMSNPGRWMMHCHIAEHLGSGMMAVFTVVPKGPHQHAGAAGAASHESHTGGTHASHARTRR
jgi:FtsP/CotA-like multicopper oxidase with cupredoxin domain